MLLLFAATHFLNLALGLWSVQAMESVQAWRTAMTRSWLGSAVLGSALLIHVALALIKLSQRSTLKMPPWEAVQILSGLAIPFLLFPHIVNTRVAWTLFGVSDTYSYELVRLWPVKAPDQTVLLLLVWLHGLVGLHYWLRLSLTYRRLAPLLLILATAIPVAALAGFMVAGRSMAPVIADPAAFQALKQASHWPGKVASEDLAAWRDAVRILFGTLVALAIATVAIRRILASREGKLSVHYVSGPTVAARAGATLLEISRDHGVPHAAVCGGRARCSTCRIRVLSGGDKLPPPGRAERHTLLRIQAPPGVRLACRVRPTADVTVVRLIHPLWDAESIPLVNGPEMLGAERTLVVLFLDIRDFSRIADGRLPFDVFFMLNQLYAAVGEALQHEGGWINKYMGDGLIAVFGRDCEADVAARQALRAAAAIDMALDYVNTALLSEIGEIIRIGMGVHSGRVVLGRIGFAESADLTVIGTAVNIASRLEELTKQFDCQLALSQDVADLAGWDGKDARCELVDIRGTLRRVPVLLQKHARNLPDWIITPPPAAKELTRSAGEKASAAKEKGPTR
ncbi:MAG: adenylate/guanylate cyclase domain-containing protein [Hyphomicrobiaceae bacterium]